MLPEAAIQELFAWMKDIPDETTTQGTENNRTWRTAVLVVFNKYEFPMP
jgi:hypothetical protein